MALTHENITDVDLVLVSPSGAASILMSDACGTGNLVATSLRLYRIGGGATQPDRSVSGRELSADELRHLG